ncbi:MAG: phosphodiesterase [Campylobacterales bacterium]|nr:phosphodiesterase [Campylobacterales bacterium]
MQNNNKKFFFAFSFFILTLIGLGYYYFELERRHINHTINASLQRAAQSAHLVIGDRYHDQILRTPPTEVEDANIIKALTTLAHTQGVEYIYSLVLDAEGRLRFTSSSARQNELSNGIHLTRYNDPYNANPDIIKAFKTNQVVWDRNENGEKSGTFRSLYIPHTTPSGHRYVIGADIEADGIEKLSNAAAFKATMTSLLLFLGALPLLLIYRSTLKVTANRLRHDVKLATEKLRDVNEILENKIEEKTQQLISQSFEDALTGLPNRHCLQYDLDRKQFHALMILNLRNFREINDFFGTSIGDHLISQAGHWLRSFSLSPYRLSGDEFALLIDEAYTIGELETLASRLIHKLAEHPFNAGVENVSLGVTIGIDPGPDISLAHADIALHEAKGSPKHFAFYSSEKHIEEQYQANIAMTKMIHEALHEGRIVCYYQPIVSTVTGRIDKYETLVRMMDESSNIIPPDRFIRIAQKTHVYPQITRTVIAQACQAFQNRNEEFSVNLSIRDILDSQTITFIEEEILRTATAHRIVFEVLESEGIENFEAVLAFIRRMKKLGAKIAIDDFGTGYSSIENILTLKVDYIKIDGSLIRLLESDSRRSSIIESIAKCASKLGAKTVAEFVESEGLFNHIKSAGIDFAQGYYVGKPAPLTPQ